MAKKKVMITISESDLKHCKEQSFKKLKDTNVSGYIALLIEKDKQNLNLEDCECDYVKVQDNHIECTRCGSVIEFRN